jgi:hypothetical protein
VKEDIMKGNVKINQSEDISFEEKRKKRKINIWGVYISLIFIIVGLVWYGVNVGLISLAVMQQIAGPIIIVLIGILLLIKSLWT